LEGTKVHGTFDTLKRLAKEPIVLLLLVASTIYFISGNTSVVIFMATAIVLVSAISLYQDDCSRNALEKLKNLTQAKCHSCGRMLFGL
jgi:Ca2+-transporting ATPase